MVNARLREVLLRATGLGGLAAADARIGRAAHPVCGDEVELSVRLDGSTLAAVGWRAHACPATVAVATLAAEVLPGTSTDAAAEALRGALAAHGGLERHERHAEAIVLKALAAAIGA